MLGQNCCESEADIRPARATIEALTGKRPVSYPTPTLSMNAILREDDPIEGREWFYRRRVTNKVRWLWVVVDFNQAPAYVVTAFIQRKDPTR